MTRRFGLIGKNIDYSFSRNYFDKKFEREKLKNNTYENFDIDTIDLFSTAVKTQKDICGYNVTIPYKQDIISHLDSLSKTAKKIGAVNTIRVTKKGNLKGYNTDWYGFYHSLKPLLKFHHKRALILGTGGASKAVKYALKKLNIKYLQVSRTKTDKTITYSEITAELMQKYTIVINTTPLGTSPDIQNKPALDYSLFSPRHIAYDLIYNPEQTSFMHHAKQHGAIVKNGYEMLVLQAEKAWRIWNR
ncbi:MULTISPECIES: shikimate dehydrogenase family protein [Myroides]|uniref:Shikimate dehydrogenase n=1 Tax=Myroides albus TaxID=2562892 RepID=A0A6I3LH80_9FLAO|nr:MULTISPECIES: shikimate dehydrogenase [Myroides]MTG97144.1 shikimate dehydrogenase [Myroides albus]MVX35704.1 shikimate dehydrogenase [Myroides sp. LoEW2-1]